MISFVLQAALPAKRRVKGSPAPEGMRLTLTGLGVARLFFRRRGAGRWSRLWPASGDHIAHVRAFPQLFEEGLAVFAAAHRNDFKVAGVLEQPFLKIADDAVAYAEQDEQGSQHGRQRKHRAQGQGALVPVVPQGMPQMWKTHVHPAAWC